MLMVDSHCPGEAEIKLEYNWQGKVKIKDRISRTRGYQTDWRRNFSGHLSIGTVNINDEHCKAYMHFVRAYKDFISRAGRPFPRSYVYIVTKALLVGNQPYAMSIRIRIPSGHELTYDTAKHELAHIARHTMDGSWAHFLGDALKYGYARNHNCDTLTNAGFAFNEGWAGYWEGDCSCTTGDGTDMRIEGNVAGALCKLAKCKGDPRMWSILAANRGGIHTYSEFERKIGKC